MNYTLSGTYINYYPFFYYFVFETVPHVGRDIKFHVISITPANNKVQKISLKSFKPQWGHKKNTIWVNDIIKFSFIDIRCKP